MDGCCPAGEPANDWEGQFDRRFAERELRAFQRKGPARATRVLLDAIEAEGANGRTILDVGGGVGAIGLTLLAAGAATATQLDASTGFLAVAEAEAMRRGVGDRVRFVHGDAVAVAPTLEPADIVTLDRVICCDPRLEALVTATAGRATSLYGLVYPHDAWWTRLVARLGHGWARLTRSRFRFWVHPVTRLEAILDELGFERRTQQRVGAFWEAALFARR